MKRTKRRLKLGLPVKEGEREGIVAAQIRKVELKILKQKLEKAQDDLVIARRETKHWQNMYKELKVQLIKFSKLIMMSVTMITK